VIRAARSASRLISVRCARRVHRRLPTSLAAERAWVRLCARPPPALRAEACVHARVCCFSPIPQGVSTRARQCNKCMHPWHDSVYAGV